METEDDKIKKCVYRQQKIWGVDTYFIYPEHYSQVMELLNLHRWGLAISDIVNKVKTLELLPAVVYIPRFGEKYRWMPIMCYKNGGDFYHVKYHGGWMCRECRTNNGPVIMPMSEADATYYEFPLPPIPEVFRKVNCKKCGKPLQNHLIMIDEE